MTMPITVLQRQRPDGGYGWFIVFAAFLCQVCVAGTTKSAGLLFLYFRDMYGASNSATSSITLIQKLSDTATALIWSVLAERYGSRIIVFLGGITVFCGICASYFATDIFYLTISYGVVCGVGFSMITYPAVQMLPRYFEHRLVLATALLYCGTPVGSLTVPYIIDCAVLEYGINGAFVIMAAIFLHVFVSAALLRPVEYNYVSPTIPRQEPPFIGPVVEVTCTESPKLSPKLNGKAIGIDNSSCYCRSISECVHLNGGARAVATSPTPTAVPVDADSSMCLSMGTIQPLPSTPTPTVNVFGDMLNSQQNVVTKSAALPSRNGVPRPPCAAKAISQYQRQQQRSILDVLRLRRLRSNLSVGSVTGEEQPLVAENPAPAMGNIALSFAIMDNMSMASQTAATAICRQFSIIPTAVTTNPLYSQVLTTAKRLPPPNTTIKATEAPAVMATATSIIEDQKAPVDQSVAATFATALPTSNQQSPPGIFGALFEKFLTIFRMRLFILLALSTFLHSYAMSLWVIFQQAYVRDAGFNGRFEQLFLISVSSLTELIARLTLGFVISRNCWRIHRWNQLGCTIMAIGMMTYPLMTNYIAIVIYNCCMAATFSIMVVTSMPNLKEYLGIDMAGLAQGLMVIPAGLGITSVQVGGVIRDYAGSFVPGFYMCAASLLMSVLNFQLIGYLAAKQKSPYWACCSPNTNEVNIQLEEDIEGTGDSSKLEDGNPEFTEEVIALLQKQQIKSVGANGNDHLKLSSPTGSTPFATPLATSPNHKQNSN